MKGLLVIKILKKIKFDGVWLELEGKKMFPETIINEIVQENCRFHVK